MKVLISDTLEQSGLDVLIHEGLTADYKPGLSPAELATAITEYDALIVRSATKVTADVINASTRLRVIGRAGTGVDNIDTASATRKGILVMNTPGGNTISAAEHTVSMMLSLARNIPQANASMRRGEWDRKTFVGAEVFEKTIGVIGLGKIGREVAQRCKGLGMKVLGFDPVLAPEVAVKSGIVLVSLDELYRRSDFVTLHTPLTPETKWMINEEVLGRCKRGVRVINCARGGIVEETGLLKALSSGQVAGAALDVFEEEPPRRSALVEHPRVITTPHLGASTEEAQEKVAIQIAQQVADALCGRGYAGVVNGGALHLTMNEEVRPLLDLAERLGSLAAQASTGKLQRLTVGVFGDVAVSSLEILKAGVLKGVLSRSLHEPVNFINAISIAEEMGLHVREEKDDHGDNFQTLLRVHYETDVESLEVAGTTYGPATIRVVRIGKFRVEIKPEGWLLIYRNLDKPGMLARVGGVLASFDVNIAGVSLGRTRIGETALTIMNIDNEIPAAAVQELRSIEGVSNVKVVQLENREG